MHGEDKTKEQLLQEVTALRERVAVLEVREAERREAENALRIAKEYAETIINSSLDMIIAVDRQRLITEFNPAAEQAFGYCKTEVIGRPADLLYADPLQGEGIHKATVLRGGLSTEIRNKRRNGEIFDSLLEASLLRSPDGEIVGIMGVGRDISERKRARETQARLTAILEATPDAVGISVLSGQMLYLNRAGRKLLGIDDDQLLAAVNVLDFHPEDVRIRLSEILPTVIHNGQWSGETTVRTSQGREVPVSQVILAHKDHEGVVQFFSTIMRDISAQKQAETAIRESEEKYRELVENIAELIYIVDVNGIVTYISPVIKAMGGYDPQEIIGQPFTNFIHPDDLPGLLESFQRTITGDLHASEFRVCTQSGDFLWVRSASRPMCRDGTIVGLRGVLTDITENKRVEAALRESEERYRNLFENANDAIATFTIDSVFTSCNRGAERMLGWRREEIVGQHVSKVLTPVAFALVEERTRRFLAGDKPASSTFEVEFIHKDGRTVPIEARTRTIRDSTGKPIGFQGIFRDVSAKKALERQRSDFLAMLAHDIKNPLAAILGYVDLLQQDNAGLSSLEGEFIQRIRENAQAIHSLISNYLDLARAEAGTVVLQKTLLSLDVILQRVVQQYAGIAQRHHVNLSLEIAEKLPLCSADGMALERVFSNLIRNALKFTPETGQIVVRAQRWQPKPGEDRDSTPPSVSSSPENSGIVVEVVDTGPGIAAEEIPLLFQKYHPFAHGRDHEGTGLGLFVVKTFVEAHGGWVEVDSTLGRGACFRVVLPALAN
ncbi:MAG: PAS domain S-box protein [Candidatus Binatia bacterium]